MFAAACALILGVLACVTPDTTSGPETAQAVQLTVIAGLTQANIQITPDDSKATQYAGFLQTSIANQVLLTQGAQGGAIGTAVAQTIQAGVATPQPPPATITVGPAQPTSAQPTAAHARSKPGRASQLCSAQVRTSGAACQVAGSRNRWRHSGLRHGMSAR